MDVIKMLAELRQEREQLEEAILTLERLARGRGKRRGRPPAWMTEIKRRGRPPGSKNKPKPEAKATTKALAAASANMRHYRLRIKPLAHARGSVPSRDRQGTEANVDVAFE